MQKTPGNDPRKLLPRWRPLERTPRLEIADVRSLIGKVPSFEFEVDRSRKEWLAAGTVEAARELVEAAVVFNEPAAASDAVEFLTGLSDERVAGQELLRRVSSGERTAKTWEGLRARIAGLKKDLLMYPSNPLLRSELALAFTGLGQSRGAIREMEIALSQAPNSRILLRSAARCFVHFGEADRALHWLKPSASASDPWVLAAATATADLVGDLRSVDVRKIRVVLAQDIAPEHLAELAVALATLEIAHGNVKRGRKIVGRFRRHLNENAAAQAKWLEEHDRLNLDIDLEKVEGAYEARASELHVRGEWMAAVGMTRKWHSDEPFSSRAAILGSYIASAFLGDHETADNLLSLALIANPSDVNLLNNRAYAQSELNQLDAAHNTLQIARSFPKTEEQGIVLSATEAHLLMKAGDGVAGLERYSMAAQQAADKGHFGTRDHIVVHWLRELYLAGYSIGSSERQAIEHHFSAHGGAGSEAKRLFRRLAQPAFDAMEALDNVVEMTSLPDTLSKGGA